MLETQTRLAFNTPALRQYFNENKRGVEVKVKGDNVLIRQSNSAAANILPLSLRGTIGRQIYPGILLNLLMEKFIKSGYESSRPFFIMVPEKDGWFKLDHYDADDAPKTVPHVRLWVVEKEEYVDNVDIQELTSLVDGFIKRMANYKETVLKYDSQHLMGRPPKVIALAKMALSA